MHWRDCTLDSAARGAVAQLGERLNGIQEVDGSIPFGSTNKVNRLQGAVIAAHLSQQADSNQVGLSPRVPIPLVARYGDTRRATQLVKGVPFRSRVSSASLPRQTNW